MNELFRIIDDSSFDISSDFILIRSNKGDEYHSTPYTIADLEFDSEDEVNTIRQLTIADYSETLLDKDDLKPPLLFVFGKDINQKPIYIKLKIKEKKNVNFLKILPYRCIGCKKTLKFQEKTVKTLAICRIFC